MTTENFKKEFKIIKCNNFDVATSCEEQYGETERLEHQVYYPATFLLYVDDGILDIKHENTTYSYSAGSFCLIRKYTNTYFSKTVDKKTRWARSYAFVMPDEFLRKIVANYKFDKNLQPIGDRIVEIASADSLKPIVQDIKYAVDNDIELDIKEFESKVEKTFKAIINSNPKLAILFKEFSLAQRGDLTLFMNTNYMLKEPLEVMAAMSGRSLSTFEREFKLIFNTTAHQWILKKRLQLAYSQLVKSPKRINDVYLEAGFEDVAHFSKAFKKEYGVNPSEIKRLGIEPVHDVSLS